MKDKNKIFGKTKKKFHLVAEESLADVWDFRKIETYKEIDFLENRQYGQLEDNEVFSIKASNEDINEYLSVIINNTDCNKITRDNLKELETLFVYTKDDGLKFYIQRIMPASIIQKTLLSFIAAEDLATIQPKETYISIFDRTDIYYNQKTQKIYFTKFVNLEKIFPAFSKYHRDATKEDLQRLKDSTKYPFLDIAIDEKSLETLNKTRLKKIVDIVEMIDSVKENFNGYYRYAKKYERVIADNNQFIIKEDGDIDTLHSVIYEKYFISEVNKKEQREATSFRKLK